MYNQINKQGGDDLSIGENIKKQRKHLGLTLEELANKIGTTRQTVYKYENGIVQNIPSDKIEMIASALNTTPAYIMGWEDKKFKSDEFVYYADFNADTIVNIPIVGSVRAGQPILAQENIEGTMPVLASTISSSKEYFFLKVQGDSMNLEFKEGTMLLIEKTPCIENGEIGVVLVDGLEATVKKVIQNGNMVTLIPMSSNPEYIPKMYDMSKDEIQIMGVVAQAVKTYR